MTAELHRRLRAVEGWLDARPVRERTLVLVAVLVTLAGAWTLLWMDPLAVRRERLEAQAGGVEAEIEKLEAQGAEIRNAHETDPNVELRERIDGLRDGIESLDAKIRKHTITMVAPRAMARFLEEMLAENSELVLVRLENLGAVPLLDGGDADGSAEPRTGVFKHAFEVELRGRYLSTLEYLEALEGLPWNFFWEGLAFEVEDHPNGRATIRAYTLSSEEGWVGA